MALGGANENMEINLLINQPTSMLPVFRTDMIFGTEEESPFPCLSMHKSVRIFARGRPITARSSSVSKASTIKVSRE